MVRSQRHVLFVFGDNMAGTGFGGQAKEMRGEPNTIGVPTKWRSARDHDAFFSNADWDNPRVRMAVRSAVYRISQWLEAGGTVILPTMGVGTGEASLERKAPFIYQYICTQFEYLTAEYGVEGDALFT